jgi:transposase
LVKEGDMSMVVLGIDAHKRTHTVVAVDEVGRRLGVRVTTSTSTAAHLELVCWADRFGPDRRWAVEDCRHLSRRLERGLLAAGEEIARVPPKLMAHARDAARTYGKSDPIDALAVARAALREPGLPVARLEGPERELRLLVDHREDLVAERTGRSTGCTGTCTSWTRPGTLSRGRCAAAAMSLRSRRGSARQLDIGASHGDRAIQRLVPGRRRPGPARRILGGRARAHLAGPGNGDGC